ncbi:MAG: hypothetical protein R2877_06570 [Bdellovibrionota bacterium]
MAPPSILDVLSIFEKRTMFYFFQTYGAAVGEGLVRLAGESDVSRPLFIV